MAVLVAHMYAVALDGIASAVRARLGEPEVVAARDSQTVVAKARTLRPRVAVVDVDLAGGAGVALCQALHGYGVPVVLISRSDDLDVLALLEAGAQGIVPTAGGLDDLMIAIRTVLKGQAYLPPHMLGSVLQGLIVQRRTRVADESKVSRLSARELEVLQLLTAGADHREIATRLVISPHTAKTHIQRLLGKLEVRSRAEAVALATANGITAPRLEPAHD